MRRRHTSSVSVMRRGGDQIRRFVILTIWSPGGECSSGAFSRLSEGASNVRVNGAKKSTNVRLMTTGGDVVFHCGWASVAIFLLQQPVFAMSPHLPCNFPAAGTLLRSHCLTRHAGQHWGCGDDQQEQSYESGEATHSHLIIRLRRT